jgi:hypothetical protein
MPHDKEYQQVDEMVVLGPTIARVCQRGRTATIVRIVYDDNDDVLYKLRMIGVPAVDIKTWFTWRVFPWKERTWKEKEELL